MSGSGTGADRLAGRVPGLVAYAELMTRTGRPRAWRAVRGRLVLAFAAVVMVVLALGAGTLVSAGSSHHAGGSHSAAAAPQAGDVDIVQTSAHEHHHGNDWAPTLGQRLRSAPVLTAVVTVGVFTGERSAVVPATASARPVLGDGLVSPGLLRV